LDPDIHQPATEYPGEHREPVGDGFSGQGLLGTLAIVYATGIVFLAFADEAIGSRFMPRTWYTSRTLWYCSAVFGYVAGFYLLRPHRGDRSAWTPARPGVRFSRATLYTREGCHLCEDARHLLDRYAAWLPDIEEIDIDTDPRLVERFGTTIPVVELDGRVRFNGRINEALLRRLIEGARPLRSRPRRNRGEAATQ
jgi:hypothetical protein